MGVQQFHVTEETAGAVLGALRKLQPGLTWSAARTHLNARRLAVNGILCVDEGRRVVAGDILELRGQPLPPPPADNDVRILFLDPHIVVVDKPAGMLSLRHPGDKNWRQQRKDLQPSLEECLQRLIARRSGGRRGQEATELLAVHRIDRETSGVLVFARHEVAQNQLIQQFAAHTSLRRYFCIVPGIVAGQTISNRLIRDRGDGLRGGCPDGTYGRRAVTHVTPLRHYREYSELECRLETGRTNQIRIHLAELGHPLCGDVKYRGPLGVPPIVDASRAPRLALHAAELGFVHPVTEKLLTYESPWPADLLKFRRTLP
jgi:23S rRNA pseudouridine1911/1915/1917 synthase